MYKDRKILAIIPARGGSKGLPGKNIIELNGKPLICWTIEQAKKSKYLDKIYISTDSQKIADICREKSGIRIDELRPAHLAQDGTSSADVMKYTIQHLKEAGEDYDYVLLLEPTSPLRKDDDIDNVITLACNNPDRDGVVSLGEIHMEHPMIAKTVNSDGVLGSYLEKNDIYQRQQMDKAYFPYGVTYLIKIDVFYKVMSVYSDNILPYKIERWQCYEVDDIYDLICIEAIMKHIEFGV